MNLTKKIVVAVDGFSSCGKSTFAKLIASELGYIFIDTGAMYRTVSLFALRNGFIENNRIKITELVRHLPGIQIEFKKNDQGKVYTFLNGENVENEIRGVAVSNLVSEVSKIKEVRQFLVTRQQEIGKNKGVVMDGRDIGTVVFPEAEIKIFMTASSDVRAQRRFDELREKGLNVSFNEIKQNIEERDHSDLNRAESPLRQADDAHVLDNSYMTIEEQMDWFNKLLTEKGIQVSDAGNNR